VRLLAVLSVVRNVDDAILGGHLGAHRPKLSFVFSGRLAHNDRCTPVRSISRACRILSASLAALSGPRLTSEGLLNVDEAACLRGRRPAIAHGGPPGTRARRRPRLQTPGEHHARPSTPVRRFRLRRSGSLRRRPVHDRCGRRAGAQVETSAPRRMEQSAGTLADGHLAGGSAGGASARTVWPTERQFPPAATSNRACGSLAHGSPTSFTAGIRSAPLDPPVPEGTGGDDESIEADQSQLVA
jgi:hypothetical protein